MTDQAKLVEELRSYPWGVEDTPEGPRLLKRAADLLASKDGEIARLKYDFEDAAEHLASWRKKSLSLRAALEPFAAFGRGIPADQADACDKTATFSVGDFRRAAASQSTGDTK